MVKRILIGLLTLMMATFFSGMATAAEPAPQQAMVRVVHASPDAPAADVYVDGKPAITGLVFKQATGYLSLSPGRHEVKIYPSSARGKGNPVIKQTLTVEAGMKYSAAAVGKLANLELLVTSNAKMGTEGKAKVRFIHASPDAPAVDIAVKGGDVLFVNVPFKGIANYQEVTPGKVDLEVRAAGTQDVVLTLPGIELQPNTVYSVYAAGLVKGKPELGALLIKE
ncbi:DUF4397 domain-containing protein [Effusibacillus lacus]|uniref:Peptidase n=1 Tax=Effusibacillus lacus TaxID=1348429 RepID=A0A292YQB2_9BACL|nr:DUF4397 domain-containing protein [Effusibacillus lacus]TCS68762.1 uncharacterized protein DUF4397 [Effusibacillus lacus]GAX90680.1 peptidase [Effusibacillus lacus]